MFRENYTTPQHQCLIKLPYYSSVQIAIQNRQCEYIYEDGIYKRLQGLHGQR
jgi:hypothetical protein